MKKVSYVFAGVLLSLFIICTNAIYFKDLNSTVKANSDFTDIPGSVSLSHTELCGKLAIIIDDFGQPRAGVKEMMSIDRHLTFAIMPFLTFSESDANNAHEKGFEVILHLPMESYGGKTSWLGPRPILSVMSDKEIQQTVVESLESIPYGVGANIHMGAKAADDKRIISDILDVIKDKNIYFVDSRASRYPVAKGIADTKGITCYDRDIFLDGKGRSKEYIKSQLRKAGDIALKKGKAVAIGHVGIEGGKITANAISEMLDEFNSKNIQLVFVSELEK